MKMIKFPLAAGNAALFSSFRSLAFLRKTGFWGAIVLFTIRHITPASGRVMHLLLLVCCLGSGLSAQPWVQLGADINGAVEFDESGTSVSLSADGQIMAVGSPFNDDNGNNCGQVRVYQLTNGIWSQLGQSLNGEAVTDRFGYSVSLSADGQTLAVGAPFNDGAGNASGHVRVFKLNNGSWQLLGQEINGESESDQSGASVSLSDDGLTVAVGAPYNESGGHVRVYELVTGLWLLLGPEINGEAGGDESGGAVSLSADGRTVAIGAHFNAGGGLQSGHVRVYKELNGAWLQQGQDIDGSLLEEAGRSVSLSDDGLTVAIGAMFNDDAGLNRGRARIFKLISGTWTQQGQSINGEANSDQSGVSVSLSADGLTIAIGAYLNDGNGEVSGSARVYKLISGSWTKQEQDIDGEAAFDQSGYSVSLSEDGNTVAIGAPQNDGNGTNSGHVRVYRRLFLQEINLKGNNANIVDGHSSPNTTDHTDFGTVLLGSNLMRTFTIENTGDLDLTVGTISSNNPLFVVGTLTPASPIPGGMTATFTVTFTPEATGSQNAAITIANNDGNENPYNFTLGSTGSCPTITISTTASSTCSDDGTISVTVISGGTGPYMYSKDNGASYQASGLFSDLSSGLFQVVVKDSYGCVSAPKNTVVNPLPSPPCLIDGPDAVCTGTGGIAISAISGLSSYSWSISGDGVIDGPTNASSISVTAGATPGSFTVSLTVSGAGGCTSVCSKTVSVTSCTIDFSGKIVFSNNNALGVNNATVNLGGSATGSDVSDSNGEFFISTSVGSGSFTLTPAKTANKLNGVTVADATAIQQHVANNTPITNLYKLVAADVNKSNSITTLDASVINQSLLGNPTALAQFKTSWRFVPTSHVMANPPWNFPEQRTYTNINSTQANQDFYGIKTGDVVEDFANPANFGNGQPFSLAVKDENLVAGQELLVEFTAGQFDDLAAVQFGLRFDPAQLEFVAIQSGSTLPLSTDNFGLYHIAEGGINVAWSQATGVAVSESASVFQLKFNVLQSGVKLSEVLQLDESLLPGLAFTSALAGSKVDLTFSALSGAEGPGVASRFQLLQNRPNPFTGATTIGFVLPEACEAQLRVYDASGRVLFAQQKNYPAGKQEETLDLSGASGVLWYELTTPSGILTRKMMVVK